MQLGLPGISPDVLAEQVPPTLLQLEEFATEYGMDRYDELAIEITLGGAEPVLVPLLANLYKEHVTTFAELLDAWTTKPWSYIGTPKARLVELQGVINPHDLVDDDYLTDVSLFRWVACEGVYYDHAFDKNPTTRYFLNYEVQRGYEEEDYFECETCNRTISNTNGLLNQYKTLEDDRVCNKCYQKQVIAEGVADLVRDKWKDVGNFYSSYELLDAGFTEDNDFSGYLIGMGRGSDEHGATDEEGMTALRGRILDLDHQGFKAVLDYDALSTFGGGGYVTIWWAPKDHVNQAVPEPYMEKQLA